MDQDQTGTGLKPLELQKHCWPDLISAVAGFSGCEPLPCCSLSCIMTLAPSPPLLNAHLYFHLFSVPSSLFFLYIQQLHPTVYGSVLHFLHFLLCSAAPSFLSALISCLVLAAESVFNNLSRSKIQMKQQKRTDGGMRGDGWR